MARKKECYLCGMKLRNGYCDSCGFDVGRTEKIHYRLNQSIAISSINGKVVRGKKFEFEEPVVKEIKQSQNQTGKQLMRQVKQTVGTSGQKTISTFTKAENPSGKIQKYQMATQKAIKKEQKNRQKKVRSNNKIAVKAIVILIFVIGGIFNLFENFLEDIAYEEDYTTFYEEEVFENDPYDMATRALSEEGDKLSTALNAGEYIVGVHIPEGNYTITLDVGSGYFSVDDYENGIYLWESFGEEEEYEEVLEMQDVRLYQNAKFTISEGLVLDFNTESAQTDAMNYIENPLTETVYMNTEDVLTAGIDFPAGVYDVCCRDESAWVTYRIPANTEWYEEGYVEYYLWLSPDESGGCYNNVIMLEGTEITAEDAGVILIPSERISTTDYGTYYDYYVYE